jgi:hypothetical protein
MANYYKDTTIRLSDTIQLITSSDVSNNYLSNKASFITTRNTSYTSDFTTEVNEKIAPTNYYVNGNDISNYCIANWTESNTTNFASSSIPSWCNKIRAILIGGGAGGGGRDAVNYVTSTNVQKAIKHQNDHTGFHYNNNTDYDHQTTNFQNPHNTYSGGGGGGGGFIYLDSYDITNVKSNVNINIGTGGGENTNGTDTVINISGNSFRADGGTTGGADGAAGAGGNSNSTPGRTQDKSYNGTNGGGGNSTTSGTAGINGGTNSSKINNNTIKNYGKGGEGANSVSSGGNGSNGYYRIYFLSG